MAHVLAKDLRDAVLQFAVEGKLSSIHLDDSNINSLIDKLVLNPKLESSEPPFEIPEHWAWIQIGNLGKSADTKSFADGPFGSNLKKIHQIESPEVRIIQLSNVGEHSWQDDNVKYTSYEHLKTIARCEVHPGDFVIAKMMPAGRVIIMPNVGTKITLGSDVVKFVPNEALNKEYLLLAMRSNCFISQVYTETKGITRVRTSLNKIKSYYLPIPPIEEQARIVAKVDEIMTKIDEYEKLENQLVKLKEQFPQDMKNSLLQAGMMGKLTERLESDTPVSQSYLSLKSEDDEEKRVKSRQGKLIPIDEGDTPYEIPKEWVWLRNSEITRFINGRAYKKEELLSNGKYPILRVGNLFTNDKWFYSNLELDKDKYCNTGDLLYAWSASFGPTIWHGNNSIFHYHIWKLDYSQFINKKFLYYSLLEDTTNIKADSHGLGFVFVTKKYIENRLIPFPSIEEQQRIVDKLDELLPLVDKLAELN